MYRQAIDAGVVDALNNLAVLLSERGDLDEAERLHRRVAGGATTRA